MDQLCATALSENHLLTGHKHFARGELAKGMHFVREGRMSYHRHQDIHNFKHGEWISEPALWIDQWLHRGSFYADDPSVVFAIEPQILHSIVAERRLCEDTSDYIHVYAASFVREKCESMDLAWQQSDIWTRHDRSWKLVEHASQMQKFSFDIVWKLKGGRNVISG